MSYMYSVINDSFIAQLFDSKLDLIPLLKISLSMWAIFLLGHLSMGFFLMYKDLKGDWDEFKLVPNTNKTNKLEKYKLCIPNVLRDLFFVLPLCLTVYAYFCQDFINLNMDLSGFTYEIIFKMPLAYWIGNIVDMVVHRLWHMPFFYKYVHKEHHVRLSEMCSLSAWRNSELEFIFELPGTFLIGPYIMQMNWVTHALVISAMGFVSAIDHSGFYVNYLIDSRYHFNHHMNPKTNFADIEFLDYFFGTRSNLKQ